MTKLEQVARALAPLSWAALGVGDSGAHKNRRTASLRHARAAIFALREPPTGEVFHAFQSYALCTGHLEEGWRAMIDAVLSEGEEG